MYLYQIRLAYKVTKVNELHHQTTCYVPESQNTTKSTVQLSFAVTISRPFPAFAYDCCFYCFLGLLVALRCFFWAWLKHFGSSDCTVDVFSKKKMAVRTDGHFVYLGHCHSATTAYRASHASNSKIGSGLA